MFGCLPFVSEGHHIDSVLHNYYTKMMLLIISHVFPERKGGTGWFKGESQKKFDRSGFRR